MGKKLGLFVLWGSLLHGLWATAEAATEPLIAGPWVQLRKSPTFTAPVSNMAPTWGPALPLGARFEVEKVYGRWLFGHPEPLARMKAKDYAPNGWVYTRMIVLPDDSVVESEAVRGEIFHANYYSEIAWKKWGWAKEEPSLVYFNFLEGLILSRRTLSLFEKQDEPLVEASWNWSLLPSALAAESTTASAASTNTATDAPLETVDPKTGKKIPLVVPEAPKGPALGLSGAPLDFLRAETVKAVEKKAKEKKKRDALVLKPRTINPINPALKAMVLGRLIAHQELRLPTLTHEEIDGSIYMRAVMERGLAGCPQEVKDYWKDKHWFAFRIFGLSSKPEEPNTWYQFRLPGGNFAFSHQAIAVAKNEAELAFLLLRPLVREKRLASFAIPEGDDWTKILREQESTLWNEALRSDSTRHSKNLDVADEISVDLTTSECLAKSGYHWEAGVHYLQSMRAHKDDTWAKWYIENSIGLDYRLKEFQRRLIDLVKRGHIPESETINRKRFEAAATQWNTRG